MYVLYNSYNVNACLYVYKIVNQNRYSICMIVIKLNGTFLSKYRSKSSVKHRGKFTFYKINVRVDVTRMLCFIVLQTFNRISQYVKENLCNWFHWVFVCIRTIFIMFTFLGNAVVHMYVVCKIQWRNFRDLNVIFLFQNIRIMVRQIH